MLPGIQSDNYPSTPVKEQEQLELSQVSPLTFDSWRPYKDPSKIVRVGMNKGEIIAIAGNPDYEKSYYQTGRRGMLYKIDDWYYLRRGWNEETAILKFSGETLVSIFVMPGQ